MKKTITTITLASTLAFSLYAADIKQDSTYKEAVQHFNAKAYEQAIPLLNNLYEQYPDDKEVNFLLGRSLYNIGRYEQAIFAYERVLFVEPDNQRIFAEIAECYLQMEDFSKAKNNYERALMGPLPQEVRTNMEKRLAYVESLMTKHKLSGQIMVAYQHDDNVNNSTSIGEYDIYSPLFNSTLNITNTANREHDNTIQSIGLLLHKYKLTNAWLLESSLLAYDEHYTRHIAKNLNLVALNVAPAYYTQNTKSALNFNYNKIWLEGHSYASSYAIQPRFTYAVSKNLSTSTALSFGKKYYTQHENLEKEANVKELSLTAVYATDSYGSVSAKLTFGTEDKVKGNRSDVDQSYRAFNLGYSIPIEKWNASAGVGIKKTDYTDEDANFLNKRADNKRTFNLGVGRELAKNLNLNINYTYTEQHSNQEPYTYDKRQYKMSLGYGFDLL